ncbi:MAG: EamA family transporter [Actinomycetota bacterium]|nr:EamA family transporter [Actinomycetota bacterium]
MTSATRPPAGWKVWGALWIVYIVWGSTYLAIRISVDTIPPLLAAGVRFVGAGLALYGWLALRHGAAYVAITRRELVRAAIVGTALVGANGLVFIAEQTVPSGIAALVISSVPLWVVIMRKIAGDRVSGAALAGVGVGFTGVAILLLPGETASGGGAFGFTLIIIASVSWATGTFLSPRLVLPHNSFVSTAVQMTCGGMVMVVAGILAGELTRIDVENFSTASVLAFAYLVVMGSLVAFSAYVWLLQSAPISKVSTYAYVNPVVATFLGWVILDEVVSATTLLGAALVVASVAVTVREQAGGGGAETEDPADRREAA